MVLTDLCDFGRKKHVNVRKKRSSRKRDAIFRASIRISDRWIPSEELVCRENITNITTYLGTKKKITYFS